MGGWAVLPLAREGEEAEAVEVIVQEGVLLHAHQTGRRGRADAAPGARGVVDPRVSLPPRPRSRARVDHGAMQEHPWAGRLRAMPRRIESLAPFHCGLGGSYTAWFTALRHALLSLFPPHSGGCITRQHRHHVNSVPNVASGRFLARAQ